MLYEMESNVDSYEIKKNQQLNLLFSVLILGSLDALHFGQISGWSLEWHVDTEELPGLH